MTLYYEYEASGKLALPCEDLAKELIPKVLDHENCPYEVQLSLLVTTNEEIRQINREYRQIDAPTDVLSFPALQYPKPGDFTFPETCADAFDPESGELILGDIILSEDRILSQAEEFGHSVKREFAFLLVHSLLHLIGYDHMEEEERVQMEEKQDSIMEMLNIPRTAAGEPNLVKTVVE